MIANLQDTVLLNNGVRMPGYGLGVFKVADGDLVMQSVKAALRNGYRSIDTAAIYGNEAGVGTAIEASGIPRDQLFVTSKVWNGDQGYDATLKAFEVSLHKLGLDYLDLYLIHWPVKAHYLDTWRALLRLYEEKRVRAIGVSNFHIHHLKNILELSDVIPAVDQVELHPLLNQKELRDFCRENTIQIEAWSPIMKGNLDLPLLLELSKKYGKTPAQVVLRWHVQHGIVVIPKSVHEHRIRENAQVFDFSLSADDMAAIDALNENKRFGSDPDNFDF
ncbi:MAG: aldo/keto reductase [Spirochaetae bacterium HGW-Spirochaetae-8]|jgi:diketogulonate reductase-like aldo/keto reductase|nr:MAG: aldo/keto reductase [Spirochaetae bacterium HGW-Spirochaetae-8]